MVAPGIRVLFTVVALVLVPSVPAQAAPPGPVPAADRDQDCAHLLVLAFSFQCVAVSLRGDLERSGPSARATFRATVHFTAWFAPGEVAVRLTGDCSAPDVRAPAPGPPPQPVSCTTAWRAVPAVGCVDFRGVVRVEVRDPMSPFGRRPLVADAAAKACNLP